MSRSLLGARLTTVASLAATLTLAACADQPTAPLSSSPAGPNLTELASDMSQRQVMKIKSYDPSAGTKDYNGDGENEDNGAASNRASRAGSGTGISFHGGTVILSQKVAAVYWGSPGYKSLPAGHGAGSADGSLLGTFLRSLGGSPYFNINTSYTNSSGTHISNTVAYTQYWNNTAAPGSAPTDANMIAMLQSGFNTGSLTYDASTLYNIFTGSGVNLGGGFGSQYCAYHTHGTVTIGGVAKTVYFSAMPFNASQQAACTPGYAPANGTLDAAADYEVNTLAHEIEETTTDAMGNAWYDSRGYENADKCAWTFGTTFTTSSGGVANMTLGGKPFLVQRNWVNAGSGGCALSY